MKSVMEETKIVDNFTVLLYSRIYQHLFIQIFDVQSKNLLSKHHINTSQHEQIHLGMPLKQVQIMVKRNQQNTQILNEFKFCLDDFSSNSTVQQLQNYIKLKKQFSQYSLLFQIFYRTPSSLGSALQLGRSSCAEQIRLSQQLRQKQYQNSLKQMARANLFLLQFRVVNNYHKSLHNYNNKKKISLPSQESLKQKQKGENFKLKRKNTKQTSCVPKMHKLKLKKQQQLKQQNNFHFHGDEKEIKTEGIHSQHDIQKQNTTFVQESQHKSFADNNEQNGYFPNFIRKNKKNNTYQTNSTTLLKKRVIKKITFLDDINSINSNKDKSFQSTYTKTSKLSRANSIIRENTQQSIQKPLDANNMIQENKSNYRSNNLTTKKMIQNQQQQQQQQQQNQMAMQIMQNNNQKDIIDQQLQQNGYNEFEKFIRSQININKSHKKLQQQPQPLQHLQNHLNKENQKQNISYQYLKQLCQQQKSQRIQNFNKKIKKLSLSEKSYKYNLMRKNLYYCNSSKNNSKLSCSNSRIIQKYSKDVQKDISKDVQKENDKLIKSQSQSQLINQRQLNKYCSKKDNKIGFYEDTLMLMKQNNFKQLFYQELFQKTIKSIERQNKILDYVKQHCKTQDFLSPMKQNAIKENYGSNIKKCLPDVKQKQGKRKNVSSNDKILNLEKQKILKRKGSNIKNKHVFEGHKLQLKPLIQQQSKQIKLLSLKRKKAQQQYLLKVRSCSNVRKAVRC